MKLGKRLSSIGFAVGFMGAVFFYLVPSGPTSVACLLCPHVTPAFAGPLDWLRVGMALGLIQGLVFALVGFTIGYSISTANR